MKRIDRLADSCCHEESAKETSTRFVALSQRTWPIWLVGRMMILLVRGYQVTLSAFVGGQCRFLPTCSQYMIDAIERYGPWRGMVKGLYRICRCHPFGGSGYDPA